MKKKIRSLKVESVLYRAISKVLMECSNIFFNRKIMVSSVKLSNDLKKVDVYIVLSSLNEEDNNVDINAVIHELKRSSWLMRKSVLHHVNMRFIPELVFKPADTNST